MKKLLSLAFLISVAVYLPTHPFGLLGHRFYLTLISSIVIKKVFLVPLVFGSVSYSLLFAKVENECNIPTNQFDENVIKSFYNYALDDEEIPRRCKEDALMIKRRAKTNRLLRWYDPWLGDLRNKSIFTIVSREGSIADHGFHNNPYCFKQQSDLNNESLCLIDNIEKDMPGTFDSKNSADKRAVSTHTTCTKNSNADCYICKTTMSRKKFRQHVKKLVDEDALN